MLEHVRRMHGVKHKQLSGSHLHTMARAELRDEGRKRYLAKKAADGEPACKKVKREPAAPSIEPAAKQLKTEPAASGAAHVHAAPPPTTWQKMSVFVLCGSDGKPLLPLQCALHLPQEEACAASAGDWATTLPAVRIRSEYMEVAAPAPSKGGERTTPWPIKLDVRPQQLDEFEAHLRTTKAMQGEQLGDAIRGVSRFLDMLEVDGAPASAAATALDHRALVATYMGNVHSALLGLELLSPAHTWTRKFVDALKLYCGFHLESLGKRRLMDDHPALEKHATALSQLLAELRGGPSKRSGKEKARRDVARRGVDRRRIEAMPSVGQMKSGIEEGKSLCRVWAEAFFSQCTQ